MTKINWFTEEENGGTPNEIAAKKARETAFLAEINVHMRPYVLEAQKTLKRTDGFDDFLKAAQKILGIHEKRSRKTKGNVPHMRVPQSALPQKGDRMASGLPPAGSEFAVAEKKAERLFKETEQHAGRRHETEKAAAALPVQLERNAEQAKMRQERSDAAIQNAINRYSARFYEGKLDAKQGDRMHDGALYSLAAVPGADGKKMAIRIEIGNDGRVLWHKTDENPYPAEPALWQKIAGDDSCIRPVTFGPNNDPLPVTLTGVPFPPLPLNPTIKEKTERYLFTLRFFNYAKLKREAIQRACRDANDRYCHGEFNPDKGDRIDGASRYTLAYIPNESGKSDTIRISHSPVLSAPHRLPPWEITGESIAASRMNPIRPFEKNAFKDDFSRARELDIAQAQKAFAEDRIRRAILKTDHKNIFIPILDVGCYLEDKKTSQTITYFAAKDRYGGNWTYGKVPPDYDANGTPVIRKMIGTTPPGLIPPSLDNYCQRILERDFFRHAISEHERRVRLGNFDLQKDKPGYFWADRTATPAGKTVRCFFYKDPTGIWECVQAPHPRRITRMTDKLYDGKDILYLPEKVKKAIQNAFPEKSTKPPAAKLIAQETEKQVFLSEIKAKIAKTATPENLQTALRLIARGYDIATRQSRAPETCPDKTPDKTAQTAAMER